MIAPQASAAFVAAMEQVLDIYSLPYDAKNPVICMDETPRQLIRETREPIAAAPGRPERHDYEYERCGVCNVCVRATHIESVAVQGDDGVHQEL